MYPLLMNECILNDINLSLGRVALIYANGGRWVCFLFTLINNNENCPFSPLVAEVDMEICVRLFCWIFLNNCLLVVTKFNHAKKRWDGRTFSSFTKWQNHIEIRKPFLNRSKKTRDILEVFRPGHEQNFHLSIW